MRIAEAHAIRSSAGFKHHAVLSPFTPTLICGIFCVLPVCYDVRLSHLNKHYIHTYIRMLLKWHNVSRLPDHCTINKWQKIKCLLYKTTSKMFSFQLALTYLQLCEGIAMPPVCLSVCLSVGISSWQVKTRRTVHSLEMQIGAAVL